MPERKYTNRVTRQIALDAKELFVVQRALRQLSVHYDSQVSLSDLCHAAISEHTKRLHKQGVLSADAVLHRSRG